MDLFINILGWTFLVIIILGLIAFYFKESIFEFIDMSKGNVCGIEDEYDYEYRNIELVDNNEEENETIKKDLK